MRRWLLLLLFGPGLCAAAALPAAANNRSRHRQVIVTDHAPAHSQALARIPFRHHRNFGRSSGVFLPFGFIQPAPVFPDSILDGIAGADAVAPAGSRAPMVSVTPGSSIPLGALRSAVDERPSVETTPQGVVIVRGPGSRHLDR